MLPGGVDALRIFGAFGCDVAGDNIARMVAVKYRGLLGYSEEFGRTEKSCAGSVALGCFATGS